MKKLNQKEFFWVVNPVLPTTFLHSSQKPGEKYDTHMEGKTSNSKIQSRSLHDLRSRGFLTQKFNRTKYSHRKSTSLKANPKQEVVSITYEEIGLFPRSFSRVLDVRPVPL